MRCTVSTLWSMYSRSPCGVTSRSVARLRHAGERHDTALLRDAARVGQQRPDAAAQTVGEEQRVPVHGREVAARRRVELDARERAAGRGRPFCLAVSCGWTWQLVVVGPEGARRAAARVQALAEVQVLQVALLADLVVLVARPTEVGLASSPGSRGGTPPSTRRRGRSPRCRSCRAGQPGGWRRAGRRR